MKFKLLALFGAVLTVASSTAQAADDDERTGSRVAIGISSLLGSIGTDALSNSDTGEFPLKPAAIRVLIEGRSGFRVEPELGVVLGEHNLGAVTAGLSMAGTFRPDHDTRTYVGAHLLGIVNDDDSLVAAGLVLGGEYFPSRHFSLGAEARVDIGNAHDEDLFVSTNVSLLARFYFK